MENREKYIRKMSIVGIGGNIVLSAFKLFAGIAGNSSAMISDAVHSLSDVFATIVALIGTKVAGKDADKEHPYGHERLECIASIILAVILVIAGAAIGYSGIKVITGNEEIAKPGTIALIAACVSIVVKEAMFWYTRHYAKIIESQAFMADAWHHRTDALSSVGALAGIGAAQLGYPIFDPIAGIIICLFIFKVAFDIFVQAMDGMTDRSCSEEFEEELRKCILEDEEIIAVDMLMTRKFSEKIYVDVEIAVKSSKTLAEAHNIAECVHKRIEDRYSKVKHVTTHVNPVD